MLGYKYTKCIHTKNIFLNPLVELIEQFAVAFTGTTLNILLLLLTCKQLFGGVDKLRGCLHPL